MQCHWTTPALSLQLCVGCLRLFCLFDIDIHKVAKDLFLCLLLVVDMLCVGYFGGCCSVFYSLPPLTFISYLCLFQGMKKTLNNFYIICECFF